VKAPRCPSCRRGTLEIVTDGAIGTQMIPAYFAGGAVADLPWQMRAAPFGACNACEYCIEIRLHLKD